MLPNHVKLEDVDIWFNDESRVGQQGSLTRTWARKGTRPRLIKQQEFLSTYIFGAVCPMLDAGAALILPLSNTDGMNALLQEILRKVPKNRHAVLVVDRAPWHRSKQLVVPTNISLLYLPPYAPELNPSEQVWEFLKQNHLSNCFFDSYDSLLDACCNAWNALTGEAGRIKSLCSREWAVL